MLSFTIFFCPKPFVDPHDIVIQRNAIQSWVRINPRPEIILLGDEVGNAAVAQEFDLIHLPDVKLNAFNTPMLDSLFSIAEEHATHDILCYVNADIIFLQDLSDTIMKVNTLANEFLVVGRRIDFDQRVLIDFSKPNSMDLLKKQVCIRGVLHNFGGIDFFVFKKGSLGLLPPFAIGRPYWDNWMIWRAFSKGIPIIDITLQTKVVHQNHGYVHVKKEHNDDPFKWIGPEARNNKQFIDSWLHQLSIKHATYQLTKEGLKPKWVHPKVQKPLIIINLALQHLYKMVKTKISPQNREILKSMPILTLFRKLLLS